MKYLGFFFSLVFALFIALGLSINLASLPPLANMFDPFKGFWQNSKSESQDMYGEISLDGLEAEVEVVFDEHLIPHIYASGGEEDLYRVQGYVTAQHRLWQMEFQVLAAAGRLSEIVGSAALGFDREKRRNGMTFGAETKLKYIQENDPESFRFMEAYAEGVNAYIEQMSLAQLPIEYKLLDYRPEPWSPYKTALFLMSMAETLSGDRDLSYTNFWSLFGEEWLNALFPEQIQNVDPIISRQDWDFTPIPVTKPELNYPDSTLIPEVMPDKEPGYGSNNWAVAGSKTQDGYPILANDPHLGLNLPSLWFIVQLSTDNYSVKGASFPGGLGVILGFNEDISWGSTNADRDVRDWYAIDFKDENRAEYRYNNQWIQSTKRLETIKIKNDEDFVDTVIYTHYGPVVYDKNFNPPGKPLNFALRWTALEPSNENKAFLELNKASDYEDFLAAIDSYSSPAQNFVFASKAGNIAMKVQGKYPLKWAGQGKFLMDGSDPAFEWQGYIPADHNAYELNPERGFVSSANQHPTYANYPYYVFGDVFEYYRNRRINQQLASMDSITIEDVMQLQNDNYHLHASEILPHLIDVLDEGELSPKGMQFLQVLKDWDMIASPEEAGPALFEAWWNHLERRLLQYWNHQGLPIVFPGRYQLSQAITNQPAAPWFDNHQTPNVETAENLVRESFELMVEEMTDFQEENEGIKWHEYKNTSIAHLIPNFHSFGRHDLATGGGKGIVNATDDDWGPGWRMIVEMGPEINAFGIYPGGQSGNPGSKFYDNFIEKWASGEYIDLRIRSRDAGEASLFTMHFYPK